MLWRESADYITRTTNPYPLSQYSCHSSCLAALFQTPWSYIVITTFCGKSCCQKVHTGDVIDKDLFLISEKLQKLAPEQLRLVEDLIDACTDYFKGASGKD